MWCGADVFAFAFLFHEHWRCYSCARRHSSSNVAPPWTCSYLGVNFFNSVSTATPRICRFSVVGVLHGDISSARIGTSALPLDESVLLDWHIASSGDEELSSGPTPVSPRDNTFCSFHDGHCAVARSRCAFFNIDAFRLILPSWNLKLMVSRSGESSVVTSVFTSQCFHVKRDDRRLGLVTILSSVVAEWVASGTLGPVAPSRISFRVSLGSPSFRRRSLIFLSLSLPLKRWLRALLRALSWACASLDKVSLDFACCNLFLSACLRRSAGVWWAALNLRACSAPVIAFLGFMFLRNRKKRFYNPGLKTNPTFIWS